jgi:hypothetical protein
LSADAAQSVGRLESGVVGVPYARAGARARSRATLGMQWERLAWPEPGSDGLAVLGPDFAGTKPGRQGAVGMSLALTDARLPPCRSRTARQTGSTNLAKR